MKYELKEEDYDDQYACMNEAERIGLSRQIGYYAWFVGQGAGGYVSVIKFFDDILEELKGEKE